MRTNQRDGGVAILVKDCFEIKIFEEIDVFFILDDEILLALSKLSI